MAHMSSTLKLRPEIAAKVASRLPLAAPAPHSGRPTPDKPVAPTKYQIKPPKTPGPPQLSTAEQIARAAANAARKAAQQAAREAAPPPNPPRIKKTEAEKAAILARDRQAHAEALARRATIARESLAVFAERFPACFTPGKPVPLAIGINKQICAALTISEQHCRAALARWTSRPSYLHALAAGGARFNLDGSEAGTIAEDHRTGAALRVKPGKHAEIN